ncbi:Inter-alpha-trypsin inhibitor heavy chain-related isoform 1 [Gossypium australe]|uniref:Inter-alpha-trypsin inhibitor heavy chain-related isoform 1 n=1 Tax=Gossypium australe TaxID=47621 RepID=A0A5B6W788_9ROSI|nr:Inter-alpha-trypsin inhibitor heavy chain-related isoform 1 [Gossypium australe]
MAEDFARAVEDGLKLGKRIYMGKDRAVQPPKPLPLMERSMHFYLPSAPMVYAVISDPRIVDNPDIPSYQPHVHGRLDPPALIPLQMNGVNLDVDCYGDSAFVQVSGMWRVHCVMRSRSCDCRIAVPLGDEGSILGVEIDLPTKSYSTELIGVEESKGIQNIARPEDGQFLKPHIFTLTIPKIDGGTYISMKLHWSQKLSYNDGKLTLTVPFNFPEFVTPAIRQIPKKERIQLNVNSGIASGIVYQAVSHPFQESKRDGGHIGLLYEANVMTWSHTDLSFSYGVSSGNIFGGALLQSPSLYDIDQRDMFCICLFPGSQQGKKVFRKEVIFVVDISSSMRGRSLESTKNAINTALSKLSPEDSFNIIAFTDETFLYCTSMVLASEESIEKASEWMSKEHSEGNGTNMLIPLQKAVEMLSTTPGSIPMVFLVTDGAVEDERKICEWMDKRMKNGGPLCPRIHTLGIGKFCNHHFLRMLAMLSRGEYGAACDLDLSSESPLTICGRCQGSFPDTLKAKGILGDLSSVIIDLKIEKAMDISLDKISARQQIDLLTAQAWFSENKQLEEKVAKLSLRTCNISEYTRMILLEKGKIERDTNTTGARKVSKNGDACRLLDSAEPKKILLQILTVGFGDLLATAENICPGSEEEILPEVAEMLNKATSNCCGRLCGHCCCLCCIRCCSKMSNQCSILLTQLCGAVACVGCSQLCALCCPQEG